MEFSEKLTYLRRGAGLSQEQLADRLGVTRQSVSKWESGTAMPELAKLIALSDAFGVSIDYLVKDCIETAEPCEVPKEEVTRLEQKLNRLSEEYRGSWGPYFAYTSKARLLGIPLVSIRFGRDRHPGKHTLAVGIIAIGNFSVGVISLGLLSAGILSVGMLSLGVFALGMVSVGWAALGVTVVGVYGAGMAVNALEIAVGTAAHGRTAIGVDVAGGNTLLLGENTPRVMIGTFLAEHHPGIWEPLVRFFSWFASLLI